MFPWNVICSAYVGRLYTGQSARKSISFLPQTRGVAIVERSIALNTGQSARKRISFLPQTRGVAMVEHNSALNKKLRHYAFRVKFSQNIDCEQTNFARLLPFSNRGRFNFPASLYSWDTVQITTIVSGNKHDERA